MKIKLLSQEIRLVFVFVFVFCILAHNNAQWKTVRAGGGGAVTSMQAHPKVQNLYFITTDVGTPYRWNSTTQAWEGLFYNFPASYWGKNAAGNVAFDSSDITGNVLYATIGGAWTTGTILKSTDRGTTWTDCQLALAVKPNNDQGNGQRLAVDPNNSNVIYVTTRQDTIETAINGTFKSIDAGNTWVKINNLCGAFLFFDVSGGTATGVTKNIFIGCKDGVYSSLDGGSNFSLITGSPINVSRGAIHKDGTLYVTHNTGVSKWIGSSWSVVTPPLATRYQSIDVNPNNSAQIVVGESSWSPYRFTQFVSNNGGSTWTKINPVKDNSEVPWFSTTISQGLTDFCWDPFDQNMVWFTDFFNPHQTTNIWAGSDVTWKARGAGEEETCATGNLLCPPSGVNLVLSNVADVGGFDHKSLTAPPTVGMISIFPWSTNGEYGNMTGVAIEEANPNFIARVGRHGWSGTGFAGYSTNGGSTYTYWTCPSDAAGGRIAVSATSETMVWATQSGPCYRSVDRGTTWTKITSLPTDVIGGGTNVFNSGAAFPIAADKVNGNKFYVYKAGRMYVSSDNANTFTSGGSLAYPWYSNAQAIETTPGKEGDIWAAMNTGGLYHSTNSGASFTQIANVQLANSVSLGKASPATPTIPALYVYGTVNNVADGLFRSNDNGTTWQIISAPVHTGGSVYGMAADRQVYGRVFFGTSGNGTFYVEESVDTQAPSAPTELKVSGVFGTSFQLNWSISIDNVYVSGYDIYLDGILKATSTGGPVIISGLTKNKTYAVTMKAKDLAGNISAASSVLNVTTPISDAVNGKYESESAERSGGVIATDHVGYSGTGFWASVSTVGNYIQFSVNSATAGLYKVACRYANGAGATEKLSLYVNDVKIGQVSFIVTANWNTWADKVDNVTLNAGNNTIKYQFDSGDNGKVNIDYLFVEAVAKSITESVTPNSILDNQGILVFKNANNQIVINCDKMIVQEGIVTVYNPVGQILISAPTNGKTTVIRKSLNSGIYFVSVVAAGNKTTKKIIIN